MFTTVLTFFASGLARWLVIGGLGVVAIGGLYVKGRSDGYAACEVSQQKKMAKMETYIKKVRERIERNLPLDDDILRADPFQRE